MPDANHQPQAAQTKENALQKKSGGVSLWDEAACVNLALFIGRVFDLQKQFGKNKAQIESIVAGFLWALSPYHPERVIEAFGIYILNHSDMPTPFDIRQIIDPVQETWKPDKSYYISLQKLSQDGGPYALNSEEIDYCKKYEDHMRKKMNE